VTTGEVKRAAGLAAVGPKVLFVLAGRRLFYRVGHDLWAEAG
jgi:hypothetical protein